MQLIEIIQIVLFIFIALGAIIFLFSYLGYRTKSKLNGVPEPLIEDKKAEIKEFKVVENPNTNLEIVTQAEPVKHNPRFEVFKPTKIDKFLFKSSRLKDKNIHTPHTLFIKK